MRKRRTTGNIGQPTCTNCYVPMALCHCQKSCCSVCKLSKHNCGCTGKPTRPPKCDKCGALEAELATLKEALEAAQKALAASGEELTATKSKAIAAQADADQARRDANNLKAKAAAAGVRADKAEAALVSSTESLAGARKDLEMERSRNADLEKRAKAADAARSTAELRANAATVEERTARAAADTLRSELREVRAAADEAKREAEATICELRARLADLGGGPNWKGQAEEARRMLEVSVRERDRLREEARELRAQADAAETLREELEQLRREFEQAKDAGATREAALREALEAERTRARKLMEPYEVLQQENAKLQAALAAASHSTSVDNVAALERQAREPPNSKFQVGTRAGGVD